MQHKLDIQKKILLLKSGLRYYLDDNEVRLIQQAIIVDKFIIIKGDFIATSIIEGIFNPITVQEADKRRRGMWTCKYNKWHNHNDSCECGRAH